MDGVFDQRRYLIPFRSILLPQIFTDTLVIGAGAAGLSAALAASAHGDVIVTSKRGVERSNTSWAQGGVAAAIGADDSAEAHLRDTVEAGAGLVDVATARRVIARGASVMRGVIEGGMRVDRDGGGGVSLGREGGHHARRVVHAMGDATGRELTRTLVERARASASVRLFEDCFALDVITAGGEPGSPCVGAITWHARYGLQMIWARATVLATGGSGVVWRETTNPSVATGDGVAMAYRAGASVADLAFMQFHPTALYVAGAPRSLISEAVRGEGAVLRDAAGRAFMAEEHELGDLAPRDVVSRAIHRVLGQQNEPYVLLDARGVEGFAARFPGIAAKLAEFEIDPAREMIPVNPAAHYMIGGVWVDAEGRTDVPGMYAVGEVSCTGLHGANRLASNSLLEALVLGEASGRACEEMRGEGASNAWGVAPRSGPMHVVSDIPPSEHGELDLADVRSSIRSSMWRNAGIERAGGRLRDVGEMMNFWARYTLDKIFDEPMGWETQNMLVVGALAARSACWRAESRGCHTREDAPEPVERFRVHDLWRRGSASCEERAVLEDEA